MEVDGNMFARNALFPLMAKLICCVAWALVESVTINSGLYVPWPPICALLTSPVLAFRDMPSGNGGELALVLIEKVYGGEPPVADMVQPAYADPCVPPGHDVVVICNGPPAAAMLTVAVAVAEPEVLVAVSV